MKTWQERWEAVSQDARRFILRMTDTKQRSDFYLNQLITGHGRVPAYLTGVGRFPISLCERGEEGTVLHYVTSCKRAGFQSRFWATEDEVLQLVRQGKKTDLVREIRLVYKY